MDRTFQTTLDNGMLRVSGEVDDYGVIALRNLLAEHGTTPGRSLTVELSEVDYLPSVAIGVLTRALATATRVGAGIDLVARRGTVAQRVLMICALPYREDLADDDDPPDAGVPA